MGRRVGWAVPLVCGTMWSLRGPLRGRAGHGYRARSPSGLCRLLFAARPLEVRTSMSCLHAPNGRPLLAHATQPGH
ncbi:unnamed protein product [Gulo gulo]|uniref:Uncharacterized protein n=1 Tax=Gulo gulo TaxID=48420 RepID=A0A9X9Q0B9_GULGU|nr:unnamed protein product [Gulo gulo]